MKTILTALLIAGLVPAGIALAQERPQYYGEQIENTSNPVFITPGHRRHVVGVAPLGNVPEIRSHPDASLVLVTPLLDDRVASVRGPFERYCDQGRGMTADDWRAVEDAGLLIPDDLYANCLPPK